MQRVAKLICVYLLLILFGTTEAGASNSAFTGTKSCLTCHSEQHQDWKGSHHDLAMQHASKDAMLGDFNNSEFTAKGVTTRFFHQRRKVLHQYRRGRWQHAGF